MTYGIQRVEDARVLREYPDARIAAPRAQRLNRLYRRKGMKQRVRVVPIERPNDEPKRGLWIYDSYYEVPLSGYDWRIRELWKLPSTLLPWRFEPWWRAKSELHALHIPRPAASDRNKIAFTPSEEWGHQDRQLVLPVGRYLHRYFPELDDGMVQYWALQWANAYAPCDLQITQDADEIERVYVNGPHSCMAYDADSFSSSVHPTRVYAGPDLALAYITNRAGEIRGRAVIWPQRMIYGRVYGDIERMTEALERAGYTRGTLDGARIRKIVEQNGYVLPYLDDDLSATDLGDCLQLVFGGEIDGQNTMGVAYSLVGFCKYCGAAVQEDDATYSEDDYLYHSECYSEVYGSCARCGGEESHRYLTYADGEGTLCELCYSDWAYEQEEANSQEGECDVAA